ncbi:Phospholipid-transporting ATPase DNF2 [Cyberlindnera fabianii]|uniref:Phospholipid-transporting ATPase DNF2 n=1 Tax=Cyberlindnera fabianii TaxID=36022 RepID=A0A1V2L1Q4_CYBFA|nr:Phospholipid-transporting ATPase DNF2 [Cyberlindnera fabianii]
MRIVSSNGTPRFEHASEFVDANDYDDEGSGVENYQPRTSLDRTRLSMMRERQLGNGRVSIENARKSLVLPLTTAEDLMSNKSREL